MEHLEKTASDGAWVEARKAKMSQRMTELDSGVFQEPSSTTSDPLATSVGQALGGWWAPWEDSDAELI